MRSRFLPSLGLLLCVPLAACSDHGMTATPDLGGAADLSSGADLALPPTCAVDGGTGIQHVVIVVQENHTFDSYFGTWCTAAPGSNPTCTSGPSCCEAAPLKDPSGASPVTLDDTENAMFSPNHGQACEIAEIDSGKMDQFVTGASCSSPRNFAIASDATVKPYRDLAASYAVADRYFQPIAGASTSNDLYLAVAKEVFIDNAFEPDVAGAQCSITGKGRPFMGQMTIADLLASAGHTSAWYGEGYAAMLAAGTGCPDAPTDCRLAIATYPCVYDPGDVPFLYYSQLVASPTFLRDYGQLATDLAGGTLGGRRVAAAAGTPRRPVASHRGGCSPARLIEGWA